MTLWRDLLFKVINGTVWGLGLALIALILCPIYGLKGAPRAVHNEA